MLTIVLQVHFHMVSSHQPLLQLSLDSLSSRLQELHTYHYFLDSQAQRAGGSGHWLARQGVGHG